MIEYEDEEKSQNPVNVSIEDKKTDVEFQKWITDPTPIQRAFYGALGGWRWIRMLKEDKTVKALTGFSNEEYEEIAQHDEANAIMNDMGVSYCLSKFAVLVSPLATMSFFERNELWKQYDMTVWTTRHALLGSVKYEGDPYKYKWWRGDDVTSFFCTLWLVSSKGIRGNGLKELAESFVTSVIQRNGTPNPQHKEGLLEGTARKIKAGFGVS